MKSTISKNKKILFILSLAIFFLGLVFGVLYMTYSNADEEMFSYLTQIFEGTGKEGYRLSVFKNALKDNLRTAIILTVCAFFKIGIIAPFVCSGVKGFVTGFTTAAFIRYYGARGLLVPLSSLLSNLTFLPVFFIFASVSAGFSLVKKEKSNIAPFLAFSAVCVLIFSISAFFDGYVTTTFMKLLKPFVIKAA